jgi:glycosyltransferase involved in cell wall biosynthesis
MKKVLLVTDVNFWEKFSGNRARITELIKHLSNEIILTVVNTGPAPIGIENYLKNLYNASFFILEHNKFLNSNGYGKRLKNFIKDKDFDVVIVEYIHSSYFLNFLKDESKIILDAHDIISNRTAEFKKFNFGGKLFEMDYESEAEIFNVYDYVMVLCEPDFEEVNMMSGNALLCPHPVQIKNIDIREEVKNIVFIASAYLPNIDAINWFIANCWQQISEKHAISLSIYGAVGASVSKLGLANINIFGFVDDLEPVYEQADIIINPVRFGAGLKIKNVEALAHGIPLITTNHGARGFEAEKNKSFLIAETPNDFFEQIGLLIAEKATRVQLSNSAKKYVEANYNHKVAFKALLTIVNA